MSKFLRDLVGTISSQFIRTATTANQATSESGTFTGADHLEGIAPQLQPPVSGKLLIFGRTILQWSPAIFG